MACITSHSQLSDDFINGEIVRLETEVAEALKAYNNASTQIFDEQDSGPRLYYLPYSNPLSIELRRLERLRDEWKHTKRQRDAARFIQRVTTFPEEIQLTPYDFTFWNFCDSARELQRAGVLSKLELVKAVRAAMEPQKPRTHFVDEVIVDFMATVKPDDDQKK